MLKIKDKSNEIKLFEDLEMCLKRISDFLGTEGYAETRRYIERYEKHLDILIKEKISSEKILNDKEKEFLQQAIKFGNYRSGTGNGVVKFIVKRGYFIYLCFSEHHSNSIYIDKTMHFTGLKEDIEYTLDELGLEEL